RAQAEAAQILIGSVVVWTEIPAMVRALGETARRSSDMAALERLVIGLTEPLRQLESLAELAQRAIAGDMHATREVQGRLAALAARGPGIRALDAALMGHKHHEKCDCGCPEMTTVAPSRHAIDAARDDAAVIDQRAAATLRVAGGRVHADQPASVREDALAATVAIAAAACTVAGLVSAHRSGGKDGLVNALNPLARDGRLDWAGMPMQTMSGGAPAGFNVPSLPGNLPMPGGNIPLPGGDIPLPGGGDIPLPGHHAIDDLLGWLKKRKVWDPEIWDHPYAFWRDPLNYIDRDMIALIACMLLLRHKLQDRAAILPPARPGPAPWGAGITSITGGSCVGDQIVIGGSGLLQPNTFLLLPFADGCHVVTVPAGNWSDTTITLTLPAGVVSGPIGFGDQAYIIAYDTWALQQNILAAEIEGIWGFPADLPWFRPFRECPPDIGVNHLRAGSAIITSFTAAGATSTSVEPGGAVLLAWTVKNAEHVRIDRIGASGPLFSA